MTLSKNFFMLAAAFVALCVAAIAAVVALSGPGISTGAAVVAFLALAAALGISWNEARRDLDAVLTLIAVFLLLTAICVGIYLLTAGPTGLAPKIALGACVLIGGFCGVTTYRRQHSASTDFPNVLLRSAPVTSHYETEGVQFTGLLTPGSGGRPHALSVLLQNCFDAPRTVQIHLDAANFAKYLRFPNTHQVVLGPAEVVRVVLPVVAPTYPGTYRLYISLRVIGRQGKRVRLWRAQEATERADTLGPLLAAGVVRVGGGLWLPVGPLPDDIWSAPLPAPALQILWTPRIGTVPLVQGT